MIIFDSFLNKLDTCVDKFDYKLDSFLKKCENACPIDGSDLDDLIRDIKNNYKPGIIEMIKGEIKYKYKSMLYIFKN